jgi:hypothetical protein
VAVLLRLLRPRILAKGRTRNAPDRASARRLCAVVLAAVAACKAPVKGPADRPPAATDPLARRYAPGEMIRYAMTGAHETAQRTTRYAAECEGVVRQREDGAYFEETRWTRLEVDGQPVELEAASLAFRQHLSLDPRFEMPVPDVGAVSPRLIGPIFDLMTFYVDLHPGLRGDRLRAPGDRASVPHGRPNSWADGSFVILGEDCIDFDLGLEELGERHARLRVRHVPPATVGVRLPAEWMRVPLGDRPNNWVQVSRDGAQGFHASVGSETFDVDLWIARPSGRIQRATMDNPVDFVMRPSKDEALTECGAPVRGRIHRRVEIRALD